MMELDEQDFDTLIEAVDAWVSNPALSKMLGATFSIMLARNEETAEARIRELEKGDDDKVKIRNERATLLKAKLITMRDRYAAENVRMPR